MIATEKREKNHIANWIRMKKKKSFYLFAKIYWTSWWEYDITQINNIVVLTGNL